VYLLDMAACCPSTFGDRIWRLIARYGGYLVTGLITRCGSVVVLLAVSCNPRLFVSKTHEK